MKHRTTATFALLVLGCGRAESSNEPVVAVPVSSVSAAPLASAEPVDPAPPRTPHTIAWEADEAAGRVDAERRHVAVVVYFRAAWCVACGELERETFPDRFVRLAMKGVVAIRVDATDDEDPKTAALVRKYRVLGLPTIVVLDASGREITRLTEFVKPAAFLAALEQATSR